MGRFKNSAALLGLGLKELGGGVVDTTKKVVSPVTSAVEEHRNYKAADSVQRQRLIEHGARLRREEKARKDAERAAAAAAKRRADEAAATAAAVTATSS